MDSAPLTSPDNIDAALRILSWAVIGFAALWLITAVIGYFHRVAYNLTRAESSLSKDIKPDFLTVDRGKREAAIERGRAYDAVLAAREAAKKPTAIEKVAFWSRALATLAALVTLLAAILGTLTKIDALQASVDQLGSWDRFMAILRENQAGAVIAVAVVAANVVMFVQAEKKKLKTAAAKG